MSVEHDDAPLNRAEQEAVEWLSRLREGGRRYQRDFEDWYSADPANGDAYDRVLSTYETAGRPVHVTRSRRLWGFAVASIAAVLALVVALGFARSSFNPAADPLVAMTTRLGEIRTVALADGTRVTLDTHSAIRARFDASQRQVRLIRGRAHFQVAHEPRPFVISTDGGVVSTNGSILDVACLDGDTQVGLLSGAAEFRPIARSTSVVRIAPGTAIVAARDGQLSSLAPITANDMRWTQGMLSFEDKPVSLVIATANRYGDIPIVLADPSIGDLRFTGTIKARDSLGLARLIAAMFKVKLDTANPARLILSR